MKRFRGGLVCKAHRLNSWLESDIEEDRDRSPAANLLNVLQGLEVEHGRDDCVDPKPVVQGYLAHEKQRPPRILLVAYA